MGDSLVYDQIRGVGHICTIQTRMNYSDKFSSVLQTLDSEPGRIVESVKTKQFNLQASGCFARRIYL